MPTMSASDPGLRRVVVHAGGANVDLVLPATVPVATLLPSIVDKLGGPEPGAPSYRLSCPGADPLAASMTLSQHGIRDGAILMVSRETATAPPPRFDDVAEAVATTLHPTSRPGPTNRIAGALTAGCFTAAGAVLLVRNAATIRYAPATAAVAGVAAVAALLAGTVAHRVHRDRIAGLTLSVIAATFAGVAGLFAVPGAPDAPHVLLAAMTVAATTVLAIRITGCNTTTLTAITCCALTIALGALVRIVTAAPTHVVGSLTALTCLTLLEMAPRISIRFAGLSPGLQAESDIATRALRADTWLASLRAAFAIAAAAGATVAALTTHRAMALAGATGVLVLLHARVDRKRAPLFLTVGIGVTVAVFAIAAGSMRTNAPAVAALTAALSAGAMYLGFIAPAIPLSPLAHRGIEALGCVVLAAIVPLTCWTCGAFGAVRELIRA